ncbi:MAG: hypothetical protein FJW31_23245 [Acidobacteria bacterium]|nr:hypothetical protein [Acidobacteriota bacterium]
MKFWLGGVAASLAVGGVFAQQPVQPFASTGTSWTSIRRGDPYLPMTAEDRLRFFLRRAVTSPGTPARAAFLAAFDQHANDPEGWGQGWDAFGKRVGSRLARSAVRNGIESASAIALGVDQRYIFCNCDGMLRRTGHALAMNFVTYNRQGHWVPNMPRIGSTIAAEYIGLTWLPPGTRTASQATRGLALNLITGSLTNVWREFSPPMMRQLKAKLKR